MPTTQLRHADDATPPVRAEYFPAAQLVQVAAPVAATKWPAGQKLQPLAAAREKAPTPHEMHTASVVAAAVAANVPSGQPEQLALPVLGW